MGPPPFQHVEGEQGAAAGREQMTTKMKGELGIDGEDGVRRGEGRGGGGGGESVSL